MDYYLATRLIPKFSFLCGVCQNARPTRENVNKRKMLPNPIFPLCRQALETVEHLFVLCEWTKDIWSNPRLNINTSPRSVARMEKWAYEVLTADGHVPSGDMVVGVLWLVRKARKPKSDSIVGIAHALNNISLIRSPVLEETAKNATLLPGA